MAKISAEATAEASAEARMGAEAGKSAEAVQKRHLCRSQKPFANTFNKSLIFQDIALQRGNAALLVERDHELPDIGV